MSFPSSAGGLLRPPLTCSTNASLRIRQAAGRKPRGTGPRETRHSAALRAGRATMPLVATHAAGPRAYASNVVWRDSAGLGGGRRLCRDVVLPRPRRGRRGFGPAAPFMRLRVTVIDARG